VPNTVKVQKTIKNMVYQQQLQKQIISTNSEEQILVVQQQQIQFDSQKQQ